MLIEISEIPVYFSFDKNLPSSPFCNPSVSHFRKVGNEGRLVRDLNKINTKYKNFLSTRKPVFSFNVQIQERRQNPFKPSISIKNNLLTITRGDFFCRMNMLTKKGTLVIARSWRAFDSFLRTLYSYLLIQNNGFLIHSAGAVINGKGYLFIGKSGSGKSTICKILQKSEVRCQKSEIKILTDELMPVRIMNGKAKIYPSPFWGELRQGRGDRVEGIELEKIFFLKKSNVNKIEKITNARCYKKMLRCIMNFSKNSGDVQKIMRTLDKIGNKTKFFDLKFSNKNADFIGFVI